MYALSRGRGGRGLRLFVARAAAAAEKLGRLERAIAERFARRAHGDAEPDARVVDRLERAQTQDELIAQRAVDDVGRDVKIVREDLADEAARRERAKERAAKRRVVERARGLEQLGERRARAVELDGRDEALREVHAVGAAAIFDELEGAARGGAVERAE